MIQNNNDRYGEWEEAFVLIPRLAIGEDFGHRWKFGWVERRRVWQTCLGHVSGWWEYR